jgi:hypothetical protein
VAAGEQQLRALVGVTDDRWNKTAEAARLELLAATSAERTHSHWSMAVGAPHTDPQTGAASVAVCIRHPDGTVTTNSQRWPGATSAAQAQMTSELLDKLRRALR